MGLFSWFGRSRSEAETIIAELRSLLKQRVVSSGSLVEQDKLAIAQLYQRLRPLIESRRRLLAIVRREGTRLLEQQPGSGEYQRTLQYVSESYAHLAQIFLQLSRALEQFSHQLVHWKKGIAQAKRLAQDLKTISHKLSSSPIVDLQTVDFSALKGLKLLADEAHQREVAMDKWLTRVTALYSEERQQKIDLMEAEIKRNLKINTLNRKLHEDMQQQMTLLRKGSVNNTSLATQWTQLTAFLKDLERTFPKENSQKIRALQDSSTFISRKLATMRWNNSGDHDFDSILKKITVHMDSLFEEVANVLKQRHHLLREKQKILREQTSLLPNVQKVA